MEERTFPYGGKKLYYYSENPEGRHSIVLMHGYSWNTQVWVRVGLFDALRSIDYMVSSIDVPGFPNSKNRFPLVEEEFFKNLRAFVEDIATKRRDEKPTLLGSSASAYLALKFAEDNSDILKSVIVVGAVRLESINFGSMGIPVFGVWGSGDDVSPPSEARGYFKRRNMRLEILDGAGHACYLDKPEEFRHAVTAFLKDL